MKKINILILVFLIVIIAVVFVVFLKRGESKEIELGAVLVMTGPDAKAGQSARQGIDLAADEINNSGGIQRKKIRIIYEDDQGDPQKAVSAVTKLINIDRVPVIIGPMWSSPVLAVAPLVEKKHVVLLSPTASNPDITNAGDYVFRNTYSDLFEGSKTAEYAYKKLGYRKMGILYINNDFGRGLDRVFMNKFKNMGGDVLVEENYDPKAVDFKSQLAKIKGSDIEAIYLVGYSEVGQILKQAKELGLRTGFISTIMFEISDVIKIAGDAAEGVVYAFVSFDPELGDAKVTDFSQKYEMKFGIPPDPEAAFSYDALKIIASVIERVGTNPENIKNALYQVKNYNGVTGETTFDVNGDVSKPIGFKKVKNGNYTWEVYQF